MVAGITANALLLKGYPLLNFKIFTMALIIGLFLCKPHT